MNAKKILITGVNGQVGTRLLPKLISKYGSDKILATDFTKNLQNIEILRKKMNVTYEQVDVTDRDNLEYIITDNKISSVIHLAGIASFHSEENPELAKEINVDSIHYLFRLALKYKLNTNAVFGSDCPKENVPINAVRNPIGYFGVTKLFLENLGYYYRNTYNIDFRSIRFNPIVSPILYKFTGSTDYASEIFFKAENKEEYKICLSENRIVAMTFVDDVVDGITKLFEAKPEDLSQCIYNINSCFFTPSNYIEEVKKYYPDLNISYKPDMRDIYTQSWPYSYDDSAARKDFNWNPQFTDVRKIVKAMYDGIQVRNQFLKDLKVSKQENLFEEDIDEIEK